MDGTPGGLVRGPRMMPMHALALAAALAVTATPAFAEPSLKDFLDSRGEARELFEVYIVATEDALSWANASLENEGRQGLYCPPQRIALTADQVVDIVVRFSQVEREQDVDPAEMYLSLFVLFALKDAFPCTRPS